MYKSFFKRFFDFFLSLFAIIVLSPLLVTLSIIGIFAMRGNPFFTQQRPGKNEKIFKLIKFRTMNNKKDKEGNLLPDEVRLTKYGKFLRSTSLDELPELFNILKGDMSIVGPRPLLVKYLPYYTEDEKHRHDAVPGLTGLAQISGRNALSWEDKFAMDLKYVSNITFWGDIRIIFQTVGKVFKREGISSETCATMEDFTDYCESIGRKPLR
jgi:lipopolysaccharide/colanic/teichoic acid biosynthesis glycosyltransferase